MHLAKVSSFEGTCDVWKLITVLNEHVANLLEVMLSVICLIMQG